MNLTKYTLHENATILEALKQIELNKKGFVILINTNEVVKGTLTDGDIRRSLLKGKDSLLLLVKLYLVSFHLLM